jgi:hypothetical protein
MKYILIFAILVAIFSCSTAKETPVNPEKELEIVEEKIEEIKDEILVGKVHVSNEGEGCPFYIEAFRNGEMFLLYPVNLIEKYKIDGVKIKFSYIESKAPLPDNCPAAVVGVLDNITLLH